MNLTQQTIEYNVRLGANMHAPGDGEEIFAMEKIALEDAGVQAEIAKLKLPEGAKVVVDPWIYGMSFSTTMNRRVKTKYVLSRR